MIATLKIQRTHVPVVDGGEPSYMDFTQSQGSLREALQSSENRVYVSCRAGNERTAAILVAYIAYSRHLSYEEALAELQNGRQTFQLLPHQEKATRKYIAMLKDSRLD